MSGFKKVFSLSELLNAKMVDPDAAFIAGGTDLIVAMYHGQNIGSAMIDISDVNELKQVTVDGDCLQIGALTTFAQIAASDQIARHIPILAQVAASVGSPQIRNRATIGGNIVNASPAADSLPVLTVLDAQLTLVNASNKSERKLALSDFIMASNKTRIMPTEVLTQIACKIPKEQTGWAFKKIGRRNALAISRLSGACLLNVDSCGKLQNVRLALGAVLSTPQRITFAEEMFNGLKPDAQVFSAVGERASAYIYEATGGRASAEYKLKVIPKLIEAVVDEAIGKQGI